MEIEEVLFYTGVIYGINYHHLIETLSFQFTSVASSPATTTASRTFSKPVKTPQIPVSSMATSQQTSQVLYATKSLAPPMSRGCVSTPMQSPQGGLILSNQPVVTMSGAVFTTSSIPSIIQTNAFQPQMVQVKSMTCLSFNCSLILWVTH